MLRGYDVIVTAVSDDGQEIIGSGHGDGSAGIYRKHRNFKNVSVDILKRRQGRIHCYLDISCRFHNWPDKFLVFLEVMIYNASETNLS